jgi:argininosuccinate lyase
MGIKGTHFSHSGEASRVALAGFWPTSREALRSLKLFELVVRTAEPVQARALRQAAEDFSTVTGLADLLVRDYDLSFRAAHHVVGAVVRKALDQGIPANRIDAAMVEAAAIEKLGKHLRLDRDEVRACLDPAANVHARRSAGGPNPTVVRAHLAEARVRLSSAVSSLQAWRERLARAREHLQAAARELASGESGAEHA